MAQSLTTFELPKKNSKEESQKYNPEVIKMACLGRPFRMGMLYDCCNDTLIPGVTLWSKEKLNSALDLKHQNTAQFEVVAEDNLESKVFHLDIGGDLKLSLLCNMFDVSGSAKYLHDRKTSAQQSRVSLKYLSTTKFEQLTMDQLGEKNIEYPEVFESTSATHVVSGIMYGADAFFVFDRKVEEGENTHEVHGKMEALIKKLPQLVEIKGEAGLDMNIEDKNEAQKFECHFHGDFKLKKNPTTFSDAVEIYQQIPQLIGGDDGQNNVPKMVWLHPLSQLNSKAAKLVHEINVYFVHRAQTTMEELHYLSIRSDDLMKTKACSKFPGIKLQLKKFKSIVSEYKTTFFRKLKQILPSIRGGKSDKELSLLFQSKDLSPFNSHALVEWLNDKEDELKVLEAYLKMMQDTESIKSPSDLNAIIVQHDHVLCFSLNIGSSGNDYLDKMQASLLPQNPDKPSSDNTLGQPWFKDKEEISALRHKAKRFANFSVTNKENSNIKCVVAHSCDQGSRFTCAIVLYDNGKEREFEPPSTPSNVHTCSGGITHNSIRLEWSKPTYGAENVESYTVSYRLVNNPIDSWHDVVCVNDSRTVENLQENQGYYFKVRAESKFGYSQYSKVTDLIVTPPKKDHTLSWETIRAEIIKHSFPWDTLARHLGMPEKKIELISNGKPWETEVNLEQVIRWWLQQDDASWTQLADALQEMKLTNLARKIRQSHPEA